jgi:hypothetical protein
MMNNHKLQQTLRFSFFILQSAVIYFFCVVFSIIISGILLVLGIAIIADPINFFSRIDHTALLMFATAAGGLYVGYMLLFYAPFIYIIHYVSLITLDLLRIRNAMFFIVAGLIPFIIPFIIGYFTNNIFHSAETLDSTTNNRETNYARLAINMFVLFQTGIICSLLYRSANLKG